MSVDRGLSLIECGLQQIPEALFGKLSMKVSLLSNESK